MHDVMQELSAGALETSATLDKRWLLICQNLTGIATGLAAWWASAAGW